MQHPDGHLISYSYTERNQLKHITSGTPPPLATYTWRADGMLSGLQVDGRYQTGYQYDPSKRLTKVATNDLVSQNAVNSHSYALDSLGLRQSQLFGDGTKDLYGYDAADQVTAAQYDAQSAPGNTLAAYIDFGLAAASVQTGYRRDDGSTFGIRSDGLSYGWNAEPHRRWPVTATVPNSPDQRHDTLHAHGPPADQPRGKNGRSPSPTATTGSPSPSAIPITIDSIHAVDAEGMPVLSHHIARMPRTPSPTARGHRHRERRSPHPHPGSAEATTPSSASPTSSASSPPPPPRAPASPTTPPGTARVAADAGQPATTYTANSLDQYTFVGSNAQTHDLDGNLLTDGLRTYTWDSEGKLLSLQATTPAPGDLRIEAEYDGQSRRIERRTFTYQGGAFVHTQTTMYLYDGWNVIEERSVDFQSAPPTESHRRYTWGLDLSRTLQGAGGVGGLLMAEELTPTQTIPYYYNYDGNGNVTAITDSNGANVATYRYTAFGKLEILHRHLRRHQHLPLQHQTAGRGGEGRNERRRTLLLRLSLL